MHDLSNKDTRELLHRWGVYIDDCGLESKNYLIEKEKY